MDTAGSETEPATPAPLGCSVALEYSDRANFAMQQNGVPLVDAVRITSTHDQPLENLTAVLALASGESEPWTARIARIEPGATVSLTPEGFGLSAEKLATRTEAQRSEITCTVTCADAICKAAFPIDLLAFDEWPGAGHYAELTAAFVTPNHPRIAQMLGSAREALAGLSDSDALDGYQSASRQRVSLIAEACFNAVSAGGLGYINPPASFETRGQRVRLVDRVVREGMGTCLDLSLLLMGMWEQCGLHPVLLLPHGHAMPAVWTHEAHLPEAVIDEPARVRNLIELGEVLPVEATHLTQAASTFSGAVAAATKKMDDPGKAFYAIDIRSARKRGIRPLPLRDDGEASGVDLDALEPAGPASAAVSTLDRISLAERAERHAQASAEDTDESTEGRISRWQTKLLDLTLRNRLLNFRNTGRTLPLTIPDLPAVEDKLAEGGRFKLLPKTDGDEAYLREALGAEQLHGDQTQAETAKRLLNLYRIAKSSIEETGANVLYLALGMLKWYENDSSDQPRYAPLILLPVTLTRSSTGDGYQYTLRLSEEPLRPNVTLLEKLRVQFGIETESLDNLPEDERGIDVELILHNFRAAIRETSRWEVVESAALGLFSFNKFLMWKDLRENIDRLKQNRLVGHLVDRPGQDFDSHPFPQPEELDEQLKPDDLLCTRDADSSQLAAVRAAAEGRSFVLEGPPGTGKSQTIANIIADGLAHGKTVLFVAEKMAALSVVRKRLEEDGLGPFCLELHSAKASKRQVLAQLEEALHAAPAEIPSGWESLCEELGVTRTRLNAYVNEMHAPRGTGESLYRMLGRLSLLGDGPAAPSPVDRPEEVDRAQLDLWLGLIRELQLRAKPVDPIRKFPLRGIGQSEWSYALPDKARQVIGDAQQAESKLRAAVQAVLDALRVKAQAQAGSEHDLKVLVAAAAQLQHCPGPPLALLQGAAAEVLRKRTREAIALGRERDKDRAGLLTRYREEFLDIDYLAHIDAIKRHLDRWAVLRLFTAGGVKKPLRIYAKQALSPLEQVIPDLEQVGAVKKLDQQLSQYSDVAAAFGPAWSGGQADWDQLEKQTDWAEAFAKLLVEIEPQEAWPGCALALAEAAADAQRLSALRPTLDALASAWSTWLSAVGALRELLAVDAAEVFGNTSDGWLAKVEETLSRWLGGLAELNNWCAYRYARQSAEDSGLTELIVLYESGGCERAVLEEAFWRGFGRSWFTATADSVEAIRSFNAEAHQDAVDRFKLLDRLSIEMARGVVNANLKATAPAPPPNASAQSEIGILRRELEKKRRHLPTRRLIESMPTLLPRLKPCFLMSPLSVAQFLDAQLPPFDIVVFDEASQIPVWDAIGAIARGADVIVVGDSKQLPPTAFFDTLDSEDDEASDDHAVEDMESILKECNASGVPGMRLRWHYRSRHESLIAFSNHHYYQNELHTFPSPEDRSETLGVTFRHVPEGVYDRGGTRTNRVEAEQVVDEVVRMLRDPASTDSIGIVTFNQAQQNLIEDLFDERRREQPEIEPHFTDEVHEPVFVKNLENVQGDERDAIIFSVGYGPDQSGKPSMNFGPLNKEGGERRLNVAVTRARRRLIVFSSLTSDQIDLKRTRAVGVRHFKTFLDYARRGPQAIAEAQTPEDARAFDVGFERAVYDALTGRGWAVDMQVGCAGYRIDLAVRDPEDPTNYVLGIECDGAAYHSAKTARDRDRLRQSVLEGLGWRIERVWSTQWRINPEGCLDHLVRVIEQALQADAEEETADQNPLAAIDQASDMDLSFSVEAHEAEQEVDAPRQSDAHVLPFYSPAVISQRKLAGIDVYEQDAMPHLGAALRGIVLAESPVTLDLARQRLAEAFDVQRVTERFRERFLELLTAAEADGELSVVADVLWAPGQDPATYSAFRVPSDDPASERDIDDIPLPELVAAASYTVKAQFGLPREALIREVARLFGVNRVTARVAERIDASATELIATGQATEVDGQVRPVDTRPSI